MIIERINCLILSIIHITKAFYCGFRFNSDGKTYITCPLSPDKESSKMTCFPKEGVDYCKAVTVDKKERHQGLYKQEDGVGKLSEKKKVNINCDKAASELDNIYTCDRRRWNVTP